MAKVFDREDALHRVEDDKQLLSELMDIFLAEYEEYIGLINTAVYAKDAAAIRSNAHSIKSALGNVGAMSSFQIASSLEAAALEGDVDLAVELAESLVGEVDKYLVEIKKFKEEIR